MENDYTMCPFLAMGLLADNQRITKQAGCRRWDCAFFSEAHACEDGVPGCAVAKIAERLGNIADVTIDNACEEEE